MAWDSSITSADHTADLRQCWRTPIALFNNLNRIFDFTVDACATESNALLPKFWTAENDARLQSWSGQKVFVNPPFGQISTFLVKATEADLCLFFMPITSLITRYLAATPPRVVVMPPYRIMFDPPDGLPSKSKGGPTLGTVLLLYGNVENPHLEKLNQLGFMVLLNAFLNGSEIRSES